MTWPPSFNSTVRNSPTGMSVAAATDNATTRDADEGTIRMVSLLRDKDACLANWLGRLLQLDDDQMNRRLADVLRPMRERIAIDDVARFVRRFAGLAVRSVAARASARQHVNDRRRMRVHLFLVARMQRRLEHAHLLVVELHLDRFRIHLRGILRGRRQREQCDRSGDEQSSEGAHRPAFAIIGAKKPSYQSEELAVM